MLFQAKFFHSSPTLELGGRETLLHRIEEITKVLPAKDLEKVTAFSDPYFSIEIGPLPKSMTSE